MCLGPPGLTVHLEMTRGQDVCAFLEALSSLGVRLSWDMTSGFASFCHTGAKSCASILFQLSWHTNHRGKKDGKGKLLGSENAELARKAAVALLLFFFHLDQKRNVNLTHMLGSMRNPKRPTYMLEDKCPYGAFIHSFIAVLVGSRNTSGKNWG